MGRIADIGAWLPELRCAAFWGDCSPVSSAKGSASEVLAIALATLSVVRPAAARADEGGTAGEGCAEAP